MIDAISLARPTAHNQQEEPKQQLLEDDNDEDRGNEQRDLDRIPIVV